jgi:hypothetical protein
MATNKTPKEKASLQGKIKSDFPKDSLEHALKVPQALEDANGGKPMPPLEVAHSGRATGQSDYSYYVFKRVKHNKEWWKVWK